MKLLPVYILLLFVAVLANAQERAPSKGQCDADLNLWSAGVIPNAKGEWSLRNDSSTSFQEIVNEVKEMGDCEAAYMPAQKLGSGPYADLGKTLDSLLETRLIAFMVRHPDVLKQFLHEDAAGQR